MSEPEIDRFKKNMDLLKENYPAQYDLVSKFQRAETKSELISQENRKPNIRVHLSETQSILIHDASDPGKEANSFLSMVPEQSTGVLLIFGMGLGYSLIELAEKRDKIQWIVVFELNPEFFIYALRQTDLSKVLTDKRIILCLGLPNNIHSVLSPAQKALMLESIHTLSLTTCSRVNKDYKQLSTVVSDYVSAMNSEGNTKTLYGKKFIENRLKHLTSIHHDRKLEELSGKFSKMPALIVAAGPSLDKNIDQISKAVGKAVIISVDTALPTLLNRGIVPDFVTSIDYKELTYEKMSNIASHKGCRHINLICTSWVTHKVTKSFPAKNIFWAFSVNDLEVWINHLIGGTVMIAGAGTVAHLNYISADVMGCDPIIFVGQDLAFSESKGHASNVVLSNENSIKQLLEKNQDIMWVKGCVEPKVPVNRQMHGYRRGFERMISKTAKTVVNATEGGAFIEGTQNMALSDALSRFCAQKIDLPLPSPGPNPSLVKAMEKVQKEITGLERVIKKADKLGGVVRESLSKLKRKKSKPVSFMALPSLLQKKISDLDECHNTADNHYLWKIFNEMTMDGLRQNEREKHEIEKLEGIPGKYLVWLLRSIERVDKVNQIRMINLAWLKKQVESLLTYHRKEVLLIRQLEEDKADQKAAKDLARLYFQSEDFVLLERHLDYCAEILEGEASFQYYRGVISLYHENYAMADALFHSAIRINGEFEKKIQDKRKEIAENYLANAVSQDQTISLGYAIILPLLKKGLKVCPGHQGIKKQIKDLFDKAAGEARLALESGDPKMKKESHSSLQTCAVAVENSEEIAGCLDKNTICTLYVYHGRLLVEMESYQEAIRWYQKALSIQPKNPEIFISLADACFFIENFPDGIKYLKSAVTLDKKYAVYWFNMGRNLKAKSDYESAILAFEQYFLAQPDQIEAIKEIGQCHEKQGNMEAAREAHLQFEKLKNKRE